MRDFISLSDDDGMAFSLTSLLWLVGRGVKITVEYDEEVEKQAFAASNGESPAIYQAIGMTPSGYAADRERMRRKAKHKFVPHMMRSASTGIPITPNCSRCELLNNHPIHS